MSHRNHILSYSLIVLSLLLCCLLTLLSGDIPLSLVWQGALNRFSGIDSQWNPLLDERIPRLLVILCSGASLAVSGAVMQALFHNPLASPSVLGISSGGSFFAILILISGWHLTYPWALPVASISGCLSALLFIYFLARYQDSAQLTTLVLTGIAFSTLLIAIQGALIYSLRDQWQLIQTLTEWEAGSTHDRNWKHVHMQLPLTLVGLTGCWLHRKELDILALGEEEAKNLGVEVESVRWRLFLCVALLIGGTLATVGIIAFFGLVLPHIVRKIQGPHSQYLIPLCILLGSLGLTAMDLLLRLFSIHAFSIGNISAILGGIFFMLLLFKSRKQQNLSC